MMARRLALVLLLPVVCVSTWPRSVPAEDREGCLQCHGLPGFGRPAEGGVRSLSVDGAAYDSSRHGRLGCRGCHRDVVSLPHGGPGARVNCGMDCHVTDENTGKPYSHEALYWNFVASVHGKDKGPAIVCLTCHPRNPSPEDQAPTPAERAAVCGSCHAGAEGKRGSHGYLRDVHGRANLAGVDRAPGCPDCHSQHAVLPPENPESTVSAGRLPDTCARGSGPGGQSCHRRASTASLAGMSPLPDRRGWLFVAVAAAAVLLAARMLAEALRRR